MPEGEIESNGSKEESKEHGEFVEDADETWKIELLEVARKR